MKVRYSAPGRCGIVGNPSDIYGGVVVSCSIPARAVCELEIGQEELPEDTTLWNAAIQRLGAVGAVSVRWSTDVPRSAGLSGSTALLAATMAAIRALQGQSAPLATEEERSTFAELVRDVEYHEAGIVCGYQDAHMIVHGGLNRMDFAGKHPAIQGGPLPKIEPLDAPELPFLLVSTGVERLSGSVHGPVRDRWLAGEDKIVSAMEHVTELGRSGAEAIRKGDWSTLGKAMDENHAFVADTGGSGQTIDDLIALAKREGAIAAKLAGAGLGGTIICLTDAPDELETRLRKHGYERFIRPGRHPGLREETS